MNYRFNEESNEPQYIQLYKQLVLDISSGVYPLGTKLPSKRVIASETGLSIITVEHALTLLLDEGYIESRERSGYFVIFKESDFHLPQKKKVTEVQTTYLFEKPRKVSDFPYSVLSKTMRKVMADYGELLLVKSPNHGAPELRNEICNYLRRSRGLEINPAQIIIGSGAEYLYSLCAQLFRDEIFAIEKPSYDKIKKVYDSFGIKVDMLSLGKNGISNEELFKTKAKVLHVTPFNSYPSLITADISKKKEYIKWARERNGIILEDNYDSELTISRKPEDTLFSLSNGENVIYINTFSNTIAQSMRIGYMILPEKLVDKFNEKLGFYSCTVPLFEQLLIAELLKNGDFERHINRVRRKKRKENI